MRFCFLKYTKRLYTRIFTIIKYIGNIQYDNRKIIIIKVVIAIFHGNGCPAGFFSGYRWGNRGSVHSTVEGIH